MVYRDIQREIGKRLGDPDLRRFRGLISQCFVDSMCSVLAKEEGYNMVEIPDLIQEIDHTLNLENSQYTVSLPSLATSGSVIRLLDVFQRPNENFTSSLTLKEIPKEEYKRMALEVAFRPTSEEVFYFRRGNNIYFVSGQLADDEVGISVVFQFIENPNPDDWGTSTDLITNLNYSRNFIYRIISETVLNISNLPAFTGQPAQEGAYS
jgi:hypothetical protein|tara:strand:+ start:48 stop:671 length:624 start_codon:yes stop_codon:yes gene_type:complete